MTELESNKLGRIRSRKGSWWVVWDGVTCSGHQSESQAKAALAQMRRSHTLREKKKNG